MFTIHPHPHLYESNHRIYSSLQVYIFTVHKEVYSPSHFLEGNHFFPPHSPLHSVTTGLTTNLPNNLTKLNYRTVQGYQPSE